MPPPIPPGYDPNGSAAATPRSVSPSPGEVDPEATPLMAVEAGDEKDYVTHFSDTKPGEVRRRKHTTPFALRRLQMRCGALNLCSLRAWGARRVGR
jgi:hypothetical protein